MAFGQAGGPPASGRDVQRLLELLNGAGYDDFRDARHPMGFTQRQAGGKFTQDEVTALIERLEEAEHQASIEPPEDDAADAPAPIARQPRPKPAARLTAADRRVRDIPTDQLAAELQRRGWIVVEP